jgi:hypothetical protein
MDSALAGMSFDVIIDDGLHSEGAILATWRNLWPRYLSLSTLLLIFSYYFTTRLKDDGVYIVED